MSKSEQELFGVAEIIKFAIARFDLKNSEKDKKAYEQRLYRHFRDHPTSEGEKKLDIQGVKRLLEVELFDYFSERSKDKGIVEECECRRDAYEKASAQSEGYANFLASQMVDEGDSEENAVSEDGLNSMMTNALLKALFYGIYGREFDEERYRRDYAEYYQRGMELTPSEADVPNVASLNKLRAKLGDASNYMVCDEKFDPMKSGLPPGSSVEEMRASREISAFEWAEGEHEESLIQSMRSMMERAGKTSGRAGCSTL